MGLESLPGISGVGGINLSMMLKMGGQIGLAIFAGIAIFVVMYFVFFFFSFNIPVTLFESVGTSLQKRTDRGKVTKKDEKTEYKSQKYPHFIYSLPESKNYILDGKRKALIGIVKNNTCQWQTISSNPGFVPVDWNANAQYMNERNTTWDMIKPKQGWWDKYGAQAMIFGCMVIFLIAIIIVVGMIKDVSPGIAAAKAQANTQVM